MHHFKVWKNYILEGDSMLFFCFSSKDRHSIVESVLFHLTNYGLPVWYDRHKMLLGDERDYKNFDEGVKNCNYAIIILSQNTINSKCANEEIDLIFEKYKRQQMYIFPIFFNIKVSDLPERYIWMTKLVYKELTIGTDSRSACNHIICRFLLDELQKYKIKTINEYMKTYEHNHTFSYITKLINSYCSVSDDNHNAQIALLYAGCLYIREHYNLMEIPHFYYKGTQRLFEETRLNLPIDLRETLIFERLFLLLFNAAIFGYII